MQKIFLNFFLTISSLGIVFNALGKSFKHLDFQGCVFLSLFFNFFQSGTIEVIFIRVHLWLKLVAGVGAFYLLIPSETLFFRQTFEMKLLKNGICLTVNGLGPPIPYLEIFPVMV